jgi:prephenate dehydrogenase
MNIRFGGLDMNLSKEFTVGFIGLGLIGGSIAKSIRRIFPDYNIVAYDVDRHALQAAVEDGTVTTPSEEVGTLFSTCDYIFLCAPVHYNIKYLPLLKDIMKPDCILTDVGSVKTDIYQAVMEQQLDASFIGGHPMVGSERSGYESAHDHLIENAYYFITPSSTVSKERTEEFATFIEDLGAITIIYSPARHDQTTAYISHIPHIIASELVNLVRSNDDAKGMNRQLAAGGFKDITRIASSNPVIWEHILLSNPTNIIAGLEEYIDDLQAMIQAIHRRDSAYIHEFFANAQQYRDSIPNHATGVIRMNYEIFVDIPDEAGALAGVVNCLSNAGISLKNIGISHNREEEEGVLRISFYENQDAVAACNLLREHNYTVYER